MAVSLSVLSIALLGVVTVTHAAFLPMTTHAMRPMANFAAMQQLQNIQKQGQSQGNSASTGDASADFGSLQSGQTSNTLTGKNGTQSQAGSLGACSGGNCGINGASQISASGQQQKQASLGNQALFGGMSNNPAFGQMNNMNLFGKNNATQQKQKQSQSNISGASVGQGSAALGNVSSIQNTQGLTNNKGAQVGSSSAGSGLGSQIGLSGAVQAKGDNQAAEQQSNNADQNVDANDGSNGGSDTGSNSLQHANQTQSQSSGEGAAVGQGQAGEGSVDSAQNSNVATSDKGTLVSSNSAGRAAGKGGLKLSGASSSSGQQANQKQQTLNAQSSRGVIHTQAA